MSDDKRGDVVVGQTSGRCGQDNQESGLVDGDAVDVDDHGLWMIGATFKDAGAGGWSSRGVQLADQFDMTQAELKVLLDHRMETPGLRFADHADRPQSVRSLEMTASERVGQARGSRSPLRNHRTFEFAHRPHPYGGCALTAVANPREDLELRQTDSLRITESTRL